MHGEGDHLTPGAHGVDEVLPRDHRWFHNCRHAGRALLRGNLPRDHVRKLRARDGFGEPPCVTGALVRDRVPDTRRHLRRGCRITDSIHCKLQQNAGNNSSGDKAILQTGMTGRTIEYKDVERAAPRDPKCSIGGGVKGCPHLQKEIKVEHGREHAPQRAILMIRMPRRMYRYRHNIEPFPWFRRDHLTAGAHYRLDDVVYHLCKRCPVSGGPRRVEWVEMALVGAWCIRQCTGRPARVMERRKLA